MAQSSAGSAEGVIDPGETPPAETGRETRPASLLHILFIEDSEFDCSLLVRLLRTSGFDIQWQRVENEASMRAAIASRHWDAIISDHYMPNFSSTLALAIYNELGLDQPFIIVSGEIGEGVAVEAMLAGADDYVLKSRLARLPPALTRSLRAAESRRRRLEMESALREHEAMLQSITSNLPGMVFQILHDTLALQWKFSYASEGAARVLRALPQDLIEDTQGVLARLFVPADRQHLDQLFDEAAARMGEIRWQAKIAAREEGDAGAQRDEGSARWIELSGTSRACGKGQVIWEGVIMDITAQKEAEEALTRSREEIRSLALHLEIVKEEERKAIARDIHDDIGGILASLKFDVAWLQSHPSVDEPQHQRIATMAESLASARDATYRIMRDLRPSVLNLGIVAAVEWLSNEFGKRHSLPCAFTSNSEAISLPDSHCTAMFRIAQEALTNIVKHAHATAIRIELFEQSGSVTLEIVDDGGGIPAENLADMNRFGIRGMRERAANLGGWLEVNSSPQSGTSVMLSLPKAKAA
jgi:two-component system sensor histidine kinase UhpB